jgi:hypothetical protein
MAGSILPKQKVIIETATTIGTKYSVGQFCIGALERLAELTICTICERFLNQFFRQSSQRFISVNCTCNNCIVCFLSNGMGSPEIIDSSIVSIGNFSVNRNFFTWLYAKQITLLIS